MKRLLACVLVLGMLCSSLPVFAEELPENSEFFGQMASEVAVGLEEGDDAAKPEDITYEAFASYDDYLAMVELFKTDFSSFTEQYGGRYFHISGEITEILEDGFVLSGIGEKTEYYIGGTISEEMLHYTAEVYCSATEGDEILGVSPYCLTLYDATYGDRFVTEIATEDDLKAIMEKPNGCYVLTDNIILTDDWTPIAFYGELDGAQFTISGLNVISDQEYSYDNAGLFSENYGLVKNLNVNTGDGSVLSVRGDVARAGIIAGINYGTVDNCTVSGTVSGSRRAGGLLGSNEGIVTNCSSDVTLIGNYSYQGGLIGYNSGMVENCFAETSLSGGDCLGGLIGQSNGGAIKNSYFNGTVTGTHYLGGLVGDSNNTEISDCYADAEVLGSERVGGLVGELSGGSIANSYSLGQVNGSNYVGGLIGHNQTGVTNCYSECNVIGNSYVGGLIGYSGASVSNAHATGSVVGNGNYVGGLIGETGNISISDSYFTGSVKSQNEQVGGLVGRASYALNLTDCYARATVQGTYHVGGLIGYAYQSANITRCYTGGGIIASYDYAGGLVGYYYARGRQARIELSFSNADVWGRNYVGGLLGYFQSNYSITAIDNYATGAVDGVSYVGGLIGYQNTGAHFYNSYATGKVTATSNSGGITGWRESISSALIEKCYYDIDTTGMSVSENGIGKTSEKMKTIANYLTWDFETVWALDASVNGGYPYLRENYNTNTEGMTVISNEEELRAIANNLSGKYILNNDITLTGNWNTVGDSNLAFYGVFDGNGYTIKNFNMDEENSAFIYSVAVSGVVKNLKIETGTGINATNHAAGIAITNYGTIDNCSVTGKLSATYVGGIVSTNYAQITNSRVLADITASYNAGGITRDLVKGNVEGCAFSGTVTGVNHAGGIVAYMSGGSVTKSASSGIIRTVYKDNNSAYAGGLIGRCDLTTQNTFTAVDRCYSTAEVYSHSVAGGLIGEIYSNSNTNASYRKYVKNSYFSGQVTGDNTVGNFVGNVYYNVGFENCYVMTHDNIYAPLLASGSEYMTFKSCYYQKRDYENSSYFIPKTNAELKQEETFAEWDFENIWAMDEAQNDGMPYLKHAPKLSEDTTYTLIQSEADLRNISENLDGKYKLVTDITLTGAWLPLGSEEAPFNGILDGSGFTITNKVTEDSLTVQPLFHTLARGAYIKNLLVDTAVDTTAINTMAAGLALINYGNLDGITVNGSVKGATDYVGGITAKNYGHIYNSHVDAAIEGLHYVGGIAGENNRDIVRCSAKGSITATGDFIGGIVGRHMAGKIYYAASYNTVYGGNSVGGIIGYLYQNAGLHYSYAKGEVGAVHQNSGERFGGLVGYLDSNNGAYRTPISYSYSSASVKGYNQVGGLIGYMYNYDYDDTVSNCYCTGEVIGNSNVGALLGHYSYNWGARILFNHCYSAAKTGGVAVSNTSNTSVTDSYFNTNYAGKMSDSYFTALSDEQFKQKESFANWDFDTVWDISPEENDGYPYLRALGTDDFTVEETYDYTLIHNEEELFRIKKNLNGKYKLANDIEITDTWQPIGDASKPFTGILDGDGHKIYNFYVLQNEEYEYTLAGLFGYIGRLGEVRNLTVETSEEGVATLNSGKYAGIIAADNYGKLSNCHVKGNVRATDRSGGMVARNYGRILNSTADVTVTTASQAGGIAGYNSGNIQDSTVKGTITSSASYVGGIAGYNDGYISNCSVADIFVKGIERVGGIAGNGGTIYRCISDAKVEGTYCVGGIAGADSYVLYATSTAKVKGSGNYLGGIIGSTGSQVVECSFVGDISGHPDNSSYIGGIVGSISNAVYDSKAIVSISGASYLGGIAGHSSSSITDCYADADISGSHRLGGIVGNSESSITRVFATGAITGRDYVGGLAGIANGTVKNSYADVSLSGKSYVGGLLGHSNSTVQYCYSFSDVTGVNYVGGLIGNVQSNANVTLCFAKGNVIGGDYVGGFAGANAGYLQYNYSIGQVSGSGANVGGFLGSLSGRILNSYYDSETSTQSDTGKGLPKTTEQLKKEATYVGWDYETIWKLDHAINSGYPYFEGYADKEEITETVIEISTKEDFYKISENSNANYKLTADIELDETISSLGTFSGTLDGDNHKIYGFGMSFTEGSFVGLFDELRAGGVIKNLTVEYTKITVGDNVTAAGVLVGRNFGTIVGCSINGEISGNGNIGGLVGYNYSIIEDSSVSGTVSGGSYIGGLAARNYLNIHNCQSKANVFGEQCTGGLVGYDSYGLIQLSGATGSVSENPAYSLSVEYIGGLLGYGDYTRIDRSLAANAVTGRSRTGGLIGYAYYATITMSAATTSVTGGTYVGGLIGLSHYGSVDNCYATGSVNGGDSVGGFVGREEYTTISHCYANSEVKNTGNYTGGFVGITYYGTLQYCYSAGDVNTNSNYTGGFVGYTDYSVTYSNCYSDTDVTGKNYVGGFMGRNYNSANKYESCYARGKVIGNNYVYGFGYWYNGPSSLTNCYYDSTNNSYSDSYAVGKTAEELATVNQYKNWDFEANWIFNQEVSEYPYLSWQKAPGDLPTVIPAVSVTISAAVYAVNVGEALSLSAKLYPANATDRLIWSSSNENVAIVKDDGTVVAVSEGKTTISVTAGKANASVEIEVLAQDKSGNIVKVISAPEFRVPYETAIDEMLLMLPNVVEVMLSTGVVASLEVSWRHNAGTEYEFSGAISIPENINITNTNNVSATALVIKEPERVQAKEIISVSDVALGVVNGTSLSTVLSMLPEAVEVTLDDNTAVAVSVAWNEASEPYYNAFTGGEYTFTGKLVLPGDNSIKNTAAFNIIAKVTVAEEEVSVKNITSAMAQNKILIEHYTTLNEVLAMFPKEVYAVLENVQTVSIPVTWSSISEPSYSPREAGTYEFYGAFVLPEDGTITNSLNIRPMIQVVVSSTVSEEKTITVVGTTAEIGTQTTVSVLIDENTKMASGAIVIDYDATLLSPVGYEIGSVIEATSAMVNINYIDPKTSERKIKVSWVGASELNAGGELVKISFLVKDGIADGTQIKVGVSECLLEDMDLNVIPCKVIEGTLNAVSVLVGDINGDGKITIQDAFRILLMDIGRITFTEKQMLAADVNKDGVVDIFDAIKIQKYDIGLSDTLN